MKEGMENLTPEILTSKSSVAVTIQDWVDDCIPKPVKSSTATDP